MIASDSNRLCKHSELYYYDFSFNATDDIIPEFVIDHIEQCQNCQEQIGRLRVVLSQAEAIEPEQSHGSSAITRLLKLHFAYVGRHVTCSTARPFLPALLDPALEIRIPTPITAHLDNCQRCSEDLEAIRGLRLSRKQLFRLSQLFAEEAPQNSAQCSQMSKIPRSVAAMDFGGISAEALKHMCKCSVCRGLVYEERQDLCDSLPEYDQSAEFPCESVAATDIFDYVIPYGIDPADDQYAKFQESLTAHLRSCPTCLAKMQKLHNTVYGLGEQAESDVVTIFHIDESAEAQAVGESDDPYAGFPIRLEIAGREDVANVDQPASNINLSAARKKRISRTSLKRLSRTAVAAAAVILVAVAISFFFGSPTVKAITISQIYDALEKATNVHISSFVPGKTEPTQEKWISRPLNMYLTKDTEQCVLWDIPNGVRETKQLDTGLTETETLTPDLRSTADRKMSGFLGLIPLYDTAIPPGAEWSRITHLDIQTPTQDTEVYDLTWTKYSGAVTFKCRVFVDPKTNRPIKTKFYQKLSADTDYILISIMVVDYVSDNEIQTVIKEAAF